MTGTDGYLIDDDLRQQLRQHVKAAATEAVALIAKVMPTIKRLPRLTNWQTVRYHENGMPYFVIDTETAPPAYLSLVGGTGVINYNNRPRALVDYLSFVDREENGKRLFGHTPPMADIVAKMYMETIVVRCLHEGRTALDNDTFERMYNELEIGTFSRKREFWLAVPVACTYFSDDNFDLESGIRIVRMTDEFQIARSHVGYHGSGANENIIHAATHVIVMEGWTDTRNAVSVYEHLEQSDNYDLTPIDRFFACLRAVTGFYTGYAQVLAIPRNWATSYSPGLPALEGAGIRAYPPWFDKMYHWARTAIPVVTCDQLESVSAMYKRLSSIVRDGIGSSSGEQDRERLYLALRRINQAYLRDNDEDAVLDATVALEALLIGSQESELTHKIAFRAAALATIGSDTNDPKIAGRVRNETQAVYKYRSAIVHGNYKANQHRDVKTEDGKRPTHIIALKILSMAIRTLIENPALLKPKMIDDLIIGAMSSIPKPDAGTALSSDRVT